MSPLVKATSRNLHNRATEIMAAKRPAGFGKASKIKKQKQPSEEEAELHIELLPEIDDEELAEIYGLYGKLQEERDPRIARGIVHECNQLLRSRDEQNKMMPPKFHIVYGGALLTLAQPDLSKEEHRGFRDAGVERLNKGIESNEDEIVGLASLELIYFVHTQISEKKAELSNPGRKLLDYAVNLLDRRATNKNIELARAAHRLLLLSDELKNEKYAIEVAHKVLASQVASSDKTTQNWAHKGLGHYYMILAGPSINKSQDEENGLSSLTETESNQLKQHLASALDHLRLGVTDEDQESHVMLAETLLQWTEFMEDEKDEADVYQEALKHLKMARMLGNDGLNEIIDCIENPQDSD